jgi:hypothetical protein
VGIGIAVDTDGLRHGGSESITSPVRQRIGRVKKGLSHFDLAFQLETVPRVDVVQPASQELQEVNGEPELLDGLGVCFRNRGSDDLPE